MNRFPILKRWCLPIVIDLFTVMAGYMVCRLAFLLENIGRFSSMTFHDYGMAFLGGCRFDFSALCYVNALFILLQIVAVVANGKAYQRGLKIWFVLTNALCLGSNLVDSVYFEYIKRRSTTSVFREFAGDNLSGILGIELLRHWYLLLLFLLMAWFLWRSYRPVFLPLMKRKALVWRSLKALLLLIFSAVVLVCGIRGGIDPELRPINNKDAKEYISNPMQTALVLNTPFSLLRTIGKQPFPQPRYFSDDELKQIYTPVHPASPPHPQTPNVVILILESFGSEYSALLNPYAGGKGHTPFLDSLMQQGRYYRYSFANGNSSIDGQASVLASIPMMVESFFTSHAALNNVCGIASELKRIGYSTAFFHGADNGSLSIDGFTHSVGFELYHGRTEYNDDADWDHHWGIWDEPFLQYFSREIGKMPQPFCAGLFTLTSHHPFQIPAQYRDTFHESTLEIHKTVEYTDMALRKFFDHARRQPWYNNTLFVLTGDHTNMTEYPYYRTNLGTFQVPVVFYHPADTLFQGGEHPGIAQHIDIMPTILGYTGCARPYVAFGIDLLATPEAETYAVEYVNGIYQIIQGDYLLQFDGENATGLYQFTTDSLLTRNLLSSPGHSEHGQQLSTLLKAFVQSYMQRMNENKLTIHTP